MSTLKADTISDRTGSASTSMLNAINGSAKAWINFNGTGTPAIRASYNVTSITDNGVGDYTVNFTNALVDASYVMAGSCKFADDSQGVQPANIASPFTTTTARLYTLTNLGTASGGGVVDSDTVSIVFFR